MGGQKGGLLWTIATLQARSVHTVSVITACALTMGRSGRTSARSGASPIRESSARRPTGRVATVDSRWRGTGWYRRSGARSADARKITSRSTSSLSASVAATTSTPPTTTASTTTACSRGVPTGVVGKISQPLSLFVFF